jgi:hypothetical protein
MKATQRDCGTSRDGSLNRNYILVSHALVDLLPDGAVTTDTTRPDPSITDDPGTRHDAAGSNHCTVLAAIGL